jgi:hypothetical protein
MNPITACSLNKNIENKNLEQATCRKTLVLSKINGQA